MKNILRSIYSKLTSFSLKFKKAQKQVRPAAPVASAAPLVRPSGRVRSRDLSQPAQKQAPAIQKPAAVAPKKSRRLVIKLPSMGFGLRLDFSKIKGAVSGLVDLSVRSAAKKEIEGFYSKKNYRAVLLSISSDRSEENFLAIKRELKAQDVLMSRFPGKILRSAKLSQRRGNVEAELNKLENEIAFKAREKRTEAQFRGRISALDSQVAVFREIHKLAKK